jgi:hypothetical protein
MFQIALIDIYDSNTGTERATVVFNMANATQTGVTIEAGLCVFSLELHKFISELPSVVALANGSGYDLTRQINVQLDR